MLFNSYVFIFCFLPVSLCVYYYLGAKGKTQYAKYWLVFSSLVYYGWWNPIYLILLLSSVSFNFALASYFSPEKSEKENKYILTAGIFVNLGLIGYFKYANFFIGSVNDVFKTDIILNNIILPLGISFFTFQQISYLVDSCRAKSSERNFLDYSLFATFFPQLLSGPIARRDELLPQFKNENRYRLLQENLSVGLSIFAIGLFKKAVLADGIAGISSSVFGAVDRGLTPAFAESWCGALAYTFQLYFDFGGYSDMAIGLARMFGVKLSVNFNSPYKAKDISDFWRRWHISLSRFFRDYVYIPLGGNRKGPARRYMNLTITMTLCGLWHGAAWTFVVWGALHGLYLLVQRLIEDALGRDRKYSAKVLLLSRPLIWALTFVSVVVAWVLFRASDFSAAQTMISSMFGFNGIYAPEAVYHYDDLIPWKFISSQFVEKTGEYKIAALFLISTILPNTQQIMNKFDPIYDNSETKKYFLGQTIEWAPTRIWAIIFGLILLTAVLKITNYSEFIYFQF